MNQTGGGEMGGSLFVKVNSRVAVHGGAFAIGGHRNGGVQAAHALMNGKNILPQAAEADLRPLIQNEIKQAQAIEDLRELIVVGKGAKAHPGQRAGPLFSGFVGAQVRGQFLAVQPADFLKNGDQGYRIAGGGQVSFQPTKHGDMINRIPE